MNDLTTDTFVDDPAVDQVVDSPPSDAPELPAPEEQASLPPMEELQSNEAQDQQQDGTAAVFADPQDLWRYRMARANGASHDEAEQVGDSGISKYGKVTASLTRPMVALPVDTPGFQAGRLVKVDGPDGSVVAELSEPMPRTDQLKGKSTIEVNPAAAMAIGHPGGLAPVKWNFVSDKDGVQQATAINPHTLSSRKTTSLGSSGEGFSVPEDVQVSSQNKDGSVNLSDGSILYPDLSVVYDRGGMRFMRHADGSVEKMGQVKSSQAQPKIERDAEGKVFSIDPATGQSKDITPQGFAAKTKIFRDTTTGLAFDISNPDNPKPLNLPGNPSSANLGEIKQGDWSSVPEDVRDVAQNIANYKYPPLSGMALRSPYFQQMFKIISRVDPSFNYQNYQARQKYLTDFSGSGKIGQNILSFDTALDHMGRALDKSETMAEEEKKRGITSPVRLKAYWGSQSGITGDPRPNNYEADAHTLVNEYARAIAGAAPTEGERASWDSKLIGGTFTYRNAEQRRQAMNEMAHNLGSRLGEIEEQYKRTMGKGLDVSLLSPEAESTLTKIGATDLVSKYGSKGGTRPYIQKSEESGSTIPFPGSAAGANAGEHQIVEDENGKRFVVAPDGKLIPYGQ